MPVIGYVSGRSLEFEEALLQSFRKGLGDEGYAAGKNVALQYRFSDGNDDRCRRSQPISCAVRWP